MKINQHLNFHCAILLLCSLVFFQSCNDVCSCKKVPCPGYSNANFDKWFPYDSAQQIIYAGSTTADTDTAFVHYVSQRQAYEANKGCYHGDNGCSADKSIFSNIFNISYYSSADWDGVVADSSYNISVYDFSVQASRLGNNGFDYTAWPAAFFTSIELNGKTYQNVQAISRTDTASIKGGVYKIYLQQNTGLLAYEYYPSKTIFVKQ